MIGLFKERSKKISEIAEKGRYFFCDPSEYEGPAARKYFKAEAEPVLKALAAKMAGLEPFDRGALEILYARLAEEMGLSTGKLIHPTRLAVSGVSFGPGLYEMLELLGRETVLRRMRAALDWIGHRSSIIGSIN